MRAQDPHKDRNLYLVDLATKAETAITADGSGDKRVKYGTASWVYGEELDQTTAIWWSADSRKVAFYRFDESGVPDYYLQLDQTKVQSSVDTEAYPKAGAPEPGRRFADLRRRVEEDDQGRRARRQALHQRCRWPLRLSRALEPRRQGAPLQPHQPPAEHPPSDGGRRAGQRGSAGGAPRKEWPTGSIENSPTTVFLKDNRRFIWQSERNGWSNFYLYDLSGKLITPLTTHTTFETAALVKVDEAAGVMFYTARDGDNPLKLQLHRVGLDGRGDVRLTDPKFHHTVGSCIAGAAGGRGRGGPGSCGIAADNRHFVDVYQTHDTPPATRLVDAASGKTVAEVVASDLTKFEQLGLKKAELFTFKAADGQTTLHGLIQFPSTFDASRKYPVLVQVYGGPASASNTARETFVTPSPLTEYGFLVVNVDSRAAPGRGKRMLDQIYLKLGQVEIDDMAAGVRSLGSRAVRRCGAGGHVRDFLRRIRQPVMALVRHPDVFRGRVGASSWVTDWLNYDTIYTERYMGLPGRPEQGGLRLGRQRHAVRQGHEGQAAAVLRHRRQQRPPVEHDAAHQRAAGGRQELRRAGWPGPRPQRDQYRPHDGVLHRGTEGAGRILIDLRLIEILGRLRASRFAEVKGARASLSIPVPWSSLNELIAAALPPGGALRELQVRPQAGNRRAVRARASRFTSCRP